MLCGVGSDFACSVAGFFAGNNLLRLEPAPIVLRHAGKGDQAWKNYSAKRNRSHYEK